MAKTIMSSIADAVSDLAERAMGLEKKVEQSVERAAKRATQKTKKQVRAAKRAVTPSKRTKRSLAAHKGALKSKARKVVSRAKAKVRKVRGRR